MGKPITRFVVVSDLHCGSSYGLCPPHFPVADDGYWGQSPRQKWIWQQWVAFQKWTLSMAGGKPFALVVNGDAIEGNHHRTGSLIHVDPSVHAKCAVACLAPFAKHAARVYFTKGTECHDGHSGGSSIAAQCGAEPDPECETEYAADHWQLRVGKHLVSVWHHTATTSRAWCESGEYSRAMAQEIINCHRAGHPAPNVYLRAHRHVPGIYQSTEGTMVVTPAWQLLTRYGQKVVPGARCFVGGVYIDLSGDVPHVVPWWRPAPPSYIGTPETRDEPERVGSTGKTSRSRRRSR